HPLRLRRADSDGAHPGCERQELPGELADRGKQAGVRVECLRGPLDQRCGAQT
ncbi:unnamed protein product, partial [Symbiodinium microadriaticum]